MSSLLLLQKEIVCFITIHFGIIQSIDHAQGCDFEIRNNHMMDNASSPYTVHQCYTCPGDTECYCVSCPCHLCHRCKENHVTDPQTIDHEVLLCCDKINYIPTQENCLRHPSKVYIKYCEPCQVPVCDSCSVDQSHRFKSFHFGRGQHEIIDMQVAYKTKRQQHRVTIQTIRKKVLSSRLLLLSQIKTDFKTCHTKCSICLSEMSKKAEKLKGLIDYISNQKQTIKHRYLRQKKEMSRHIVSLQRYEIEYEQSVNQPLQFLSSKKTALPQIRLVLHANQLPMAESFNKEDVKEPLRTIQITERGSRRVENQCLLKLMSAPEVHQSITVRDVEHCFHMSCVTSDRFWVSDRNNLILTSTTGVSLRRVKDPCSDLYIHLGLLNYLYTGSHTVNTEGELIYIDRNYNINKVSEGMSRTTTIIERTDSTCRPRCVYWSPSSGDLLVGMYFKNVNSAIGKVTRYNQRGQLTQTIQQGNRGRGLYTYPNYITENNNGDVVVSDFYISRGTVVVTERGGRHRFSYAGHPSGSMLEPRGICTDALSHILVCDVTTNTVQMLNRDGQFLNHLKTKSQEMGVPRSLSYDVNTHRLWVGSWNNNTVVIYRYIAKQDALTD